MYHGNTTSIEVTLSLLKKLSENLIFGRAAVYMDLHVGHMEQLCKT